MKTVNLAIDLGTTNSLIASFDEGKVRVFKNPIGFKETLPSIVAFKKERIIVGDKAKELIDSGFNDVISHFKRKMGTDASYWINTLNDTISPVDLSSYVLKELKRFISDFDYNSVIITIPASFDSVQSQATKEAGLKAGFSEIFLLQEPIAASLAYFNNKSQEDGLWMVYDLGGGTFDIAILKSKDGEISIVDHLGDNYFGGLDFDTLILKEIVVPRINESGKFAELLKGLTSASGKYHKYYFALLKKCEDIKIQLSSYTEAEIEFEIEDDDMELLDICFKIERTDFEQLIKNKLLDSIDLVKELLTRNGITGHNLNQILLVGGSTYIPLLTELLKTEIGTEVSNSIDPTNAVAVGAAYYAGSKISHFEPVKVDNLSNSADIEQTSLEIKLNVKQSTNDLEEYLAGIVSGNYSECYFRVLRRDGGYDSGILKLKSEIGEFIRLAPSCLNEFDFKVMDANHQEISSACTYFSVVQGQYAIHGQPLPEDICIEVDDKIIENTRLEVIFDRKSILPIEKTIVKQITKSIKMGTNDGIIINILEGDKSARPSSCKKVGVIAIKGKLLEADLIKGTDIEIIVRINESREIEVSALLLQNDQEFSEVFSPKNRSVSINKLIYELEVLLIELQDEMYIAQQSEDYNTMAMLLAAEKSCEQGLNDLKLMEEDDVSDLKYQIEDLKRMTAKKLDKLLKSRGGLIDAENYIMAKNYCLEMLKDSNYPEYQKRYDEIVMNEVSFLNSENVYGLKNKEKQLLQLGWEMDIQRPETMKIQIDYYAMLDEIQFINYSKAKNDLSIAQKAFNAKKYNLALEKVGALYHNLRDKGNRPNVNYTGLG